MDREQEEIQFLGFFGIFKESFKVISSWQKIFTQITLGFILPLSFIFLAHIEISELIFREILHNEHRLYRTRQNTTSYHKISDVISNEWITFWLFKFAYFTFFLILFLLSTAAVVYTIACIYTAKEITFTKVMSVVPKVWKKLMVTFIWTFIIVFLYNITAIGVLYLWASFIGHLAILILLLIIYLVGFVYISIVWHLASVISVLEDCYGIKAMIKSKSLIKGNLAVASAIFILLNICFIALQVVFEVFVVYRRSTIFGSRFWIGLLCFLLLIVLCLFGLVIQTVIYFMCKSYHHENIDKNTLSDHLEDYLGDYVPLKTKDVQLEQFDV